MTVDYEENKNKSLAESDTRAITLSLIQKYTSWVDRVMDFK